MNKEFSYLPPLWLWAAPPLVGCNDSKPDSVLSVFLGEKNLENNETANFLKKMVPSLRQTEAGTGAGPG
jgi:hypothetical protein